MFATWCCPQEFGQPLILIVTPRTRSSPSLSTSGRSSARIARVSPFEEVIPSPHVSAPGHEVTSSAVPADASARPSAASPS